MHLYGNLLQFNMCKSSARHRPWLVYIARIISAFFWIPREVLSQPAAKAHRKRFKDIFSAKSPGPLDYEAWTMIPQDRQHPVAVLTVLLELKMLKTKNIQLVLVVNCLFNICGTCESYHANFKSHFFCLTVFKRENWPKPFDVLILKWHGLICLISCFWKYGTGSVVGPQPRTARRF